MIPLPTSLHFRNGGVWGLESLSKTRFNISFDNRTLAATIFTLIISLLVLEQAVYRAKKGNLPGDKWTIPVIGKFTDSLHPSLVKYKKQWYSGALSAVSVFNIFIVLGSSNDMARKILNSPTYAEPCLVHAAKKVLLPENWVFLHGKPHADYRKSLNVLFTRKALSMYLPVQERIYHDYFNKWMSDPSPAHPYMRKMRDLNMETSLSVFLGPYLTQAQKQEINDKYWLITLALELVNFPFAFPGTKVYNAIKARELVMKYLRAASAASKIRMEDPNAQSECLLDEWTKAMIQSRRGANGDGEEAKLLSREYSDHEIGMVVLSFLFASQDAMSSAIVYAFQLVADHPEVLAKIREEQYRVRGNDVDAPLTLDLLDDMVYTQATIKEVMRLRPSVIMVPYMTTKKFPITKDYTVPKGTMLIPVFWNSLHDETCYPEPDSFNPDRWLKNEDGSEPLAESKPQNFIVFGSGPHKCIGGAYANMHLVATLGTASILMDWKHERTPDSDEIQVIAGIFPKDDLLMQFTPRAPPS
ncbi:putative C-22 sterol desaturase [Kockovaella imperatae]|uniref:Putative C-22 sterol desaturase n=1 Tax=Kockovaella imperatae TaxID=4999 RepID=A0A1Y1UNJ6_9TREE|nr:putative C-22 sterol desaturase [Kockovaella imperatae]ORX39064.1 putative C-22 sterol desaturase [Kockovaella imperatae]